MIRALVLAAAMAALAGHAAANEAVPPETFVAARAHLVYRLDPQTRPIEGQATILQQKPGPEAARATPPRPETAQVGILVLALQQRH
ncbi:MAG TPA: hypothetical protein VHV27_00470 [Phenylobacterium sp.]|jgi:hypothetical protein|nr:hypothetical protein [Phenylobacterium sp.]